MVNKKARVVEALHPSATLLFVATFFANDPTATPRRPKWPAGFGLEARPLGAALPNDSTNALVRTEVQSNVANHGDLSLVLAAAGRQCKLNPLSLSNQDRDRFLTATIVPRTFDIGYRKFRRASSDVEFL